MKAKKLSCAVAFCMLLNTIGFANSSSTGVEGSEEKLYIESGLVQIADQSIFLNLDEKVLPITGIAEDEKGIYVTLAPTTAVDIVTCRRCGKDYDADNQSKKCPHGWVLVR